MCSMTKTTTIPCLCDKHGCGYILVVLDSFFIAYPNWKGDRAVYLKTEYTPYLHSIVGPAFYHKDSDIPGPFFKWTKHYYINAVKYTRGQWEREVEIINFNKKLEEILDV